MHKVCYGLVSILFVACSAPPGAPPGAPSGSTNAQVARFRDAVSRYCEDGGSSTGPRLDERASRGLYQTFTPPLDHTQSLQAGEIFLMRLTGIKTHSRLSFSASPGVSIVHMSHEAE